jgi:hypothetical protein
VSSDRDELDQAVECAEREHRIAEETDTTTRQADALTRIGWIRPERGDVEAAIDAHRRGLELGVDHGNDGKETVHRRGLVLALPAAGDTDSAGDHVETPETSTELDRLNALAGGRYYRTTAELHRAERIQTSVVSL